MEAERGRSVKLRIGPSVMVSLLAALLVLAASKRCADAHAQVYQYDYAPAMPPPSTASGQVNSFVCFMSFDDFGGNQMVPAQQVCNGVNDCQGGEDEMGCGEGEMVYAAAGDQGRQILDSAATGFPIMSPGDLPDAPGSKGEGGIMLSPPSGFVRLPDKLQQKEYYNGVQGKKGDVPDELQPIISL